MDFTAASFIYNVGAQYSSIVVAVLVDGNVTKLPTTIFEPIAGLGVAYRFIKVAQPAAERKARILTSQPQQQRHLRQTRNGGHIAHMRNVGGSSIGSVAKDSKIVLDPVKLPVHQIHPYRAKFTANSQIIIDNIFQEHTTRRYLQGSAKKFKTIAPTYLAPIASTQINTTALIGWTFFGIGLLGLTTLGAFYLVKRAERKNQNDEVVASLSE